MTIKEKILMMNDNPYYSKGDYVLAKYKPELYDSNEVYINQEEWTSSSDIPDIVSVEEYMDTENSYIRVAKRIMMLSGCSFLTYIPWSNSFSLPKRRKKLVSDTVILLEKYGKIKEGARLNIDEACEVLRLSLREVVDCSLANLSNKVLFTVGYEYYLHFRCKIDYLDLEKEIRKENLYLNKDNITDVVDYQAIKEWLFNARQGSYALAENFLQQAHRGNVKSVLYISSVICDTYFPSRKTLLIVPFQEDSPNIDYLHPYLLNYCHNPISFEGDSIYIRNCYYEWFFCKGKRNRYMVFRM